MSETRTGPDPFSPEKRSWIMSKVRSRDTTPEVRLRRELWHRGFRYRIGVQQLPGKPDIVFGRAKVAVFVDGEFWHGKKLSQERLNQMSEYWRRKITHNMERDAENNRRLEGMGYLVLRIREKEILGDTPEIASRIGSIIRSRLENG